MSVTQCNVISAKAKRTATKTVYTERYVVMFSAAARTNAHDALTASGGDAIPIIGAACPYNANAYVSSIEADDGDDGRTRIPVTVVYETQDYNTPVEEADPLDDPVRYSWDSYGVVRVVDQDKDGAAIDNSVGDPYDPPPELEYKYQRVRITRNEATWDAAAQEGFLNTVNTDGVTIATKAVTERQAWMENITAESASRNGIDYYAVTYTVAFRDSWDLPLLDRGYYMLDGGARLPIRDDEDQPVTTPQLLDGAGAQGGPFFNEFRIRTEVAWTGKLPTGA